MYEKSAVNELMLRSEGTLALGVGVPPVSVPQAARTRPAATNAGKNRVRFMRITLLKRFLPPSSRRGGARVRRQQGYSFARGPIQSMGALSCFVKRSMLSSAHFVWALDKLLIRRMISPRWQRAR